MFYVTYNVQTGNLLNISTEQPVIDGYPLQIKFFNDELPDLTKVEWVSNTLTFERKADQVRYVTQVEFMRRLTQEERLQIRQLEQQGDLITIDALDLMRNTKDGVNLDDPDVLRVLQYFAYSKNILAPNRIEEILS